jgi:hypothetical protein
MSAPSPEVVRMNMLKKNLFSLILLFVFSFLFCCSKQKSEYLSLIDMFPYMTKELETRKVSRSDGPMGRSPKSSHTFLQPKIRK